ncbi:MAG: Arc family DNA-binding protein [Fimbriimonadales bacterium]
MVNKQMPLRLPQELYEQLCRAAEELKTSMNNLIVESVKTTLKEREYKALYDSYTLLGRDAQEASVEYAFEAQSEVVLGGG